MYEDLFRTVQEATEGAYDVLGELGHDEDRIAFLARDLDTGTLAVLALAFNGDEIEVIPRLGPGVPVTGSLCMGCGSPKEGWSDRCANCETRGYGAGAIAPEGSPEALLRSVRGAAAGTYDVLGSLERVGGAPLYFAREEGSGRLVGLALQKDPGEREGFSLVLAWEGPAAPGRAAPVAPVVDDYAYEPEPAYAEPWVPAPPPAAPDEITDPMGRTRVYSAVDDVPPPGPKRRRYGVLTAAALSVAVFGGLAVFALQGTGADQPPPPEPTGVAVVPPAPVQDSTPVVPVAQDTTPARPAPRPEPRERAKEKESSRSAQVIIDGQLPGGWTRSVNGGAANSNPTVQLRPRRASTIVVDAPGYCTESRTFQLSPGEEQRWVLAMRERPLVGEC